jgi:DNA processing protein
MENILPWFTLKSVPGIGNYLFKRLYDCFKTPQAALQASYDELAKVEGMTPRLAKAIKRHKLPERTKRDYDRVMQKGFQIITMADPDYPPLLLQIPDPPPFLYVYGSMGNTAKSISVVGSRHPTRYGISTTRRICFDLAVAELTVISGMAIGIDSAAHEGALLGKGRTVAVLGSGLEKIYPAENIKLFHKIAENGAVISEFPLLTEPEAHNFPQRNRIISGISLGTVVVEASKKSGSLITARLAADQNREVFAVPGSIQSFKSIGTHGLIKQGAKLVEHSTDILEELSHVIQPLDEKFSTIHPIKTRKLPRLSTEELAVFESLGPYPVHIDDLARKLALEPGKLSSLLLKLELKGIIHQAPGKFFSVDIKK